MVNSLLDDRITYNEKFDLAENDSNQVSTLYEMIVDEVVILVAVGNAKKISESNIIYSPIYLITNKNYVLRIGVVESFFDNSRFIENTTQLNLETSSNKILFFPKIDKTWLLKYRKNPKDLLNNANNSNNKNELSTVHLNTNKNKHSILTKNSFKKSVNFNDKSINPVNLPIKSILKLTKKKNDKKPNITFDL